MIVPTYCNSVHNFVAYFGLKKKRPLRLVIGRGSGENIKLNPQKSLVFCSFDDKGLFITVVN